MLFIKTVKTKRSDDFKNKITERTFLSNNISIMFPYFFICNNRSLDFNLKKICLGQPSEIKSVPEALLQLRPSSVSNFLERFFFPTEVKNIFDRSRLEC